MNMSKAFDLTLIAFDMKASDLAKESGVHEADISRFRNGKTNVGHKTVEKLLSAFTSPQLDHFWFVLKHDIPVITPKD